MVAERRKYKRFEGHFTVEILNTGEDKHISSWDLVVPGVALDVSKQGMRLQTKFDVPLGEKIHAILSFKSGQSICMCETVWKRETPEGLIYGLFIDTWTQIDSQLSKLFECGRMESSENADSQTATATLQISSTPSAA